MRRSQQDRSSSTRSALETAARELFAERGYQAVPADEIVKAAGVSRGALYHHYGDKQGLFRAVFENVERELTEEISTAQAGAPDVMSGALTALGGYFDACERPEVRQIVLVAGPAVLGLRTWHEIEAKYGLGLVIEAFEQAIEQGVIAPQPVEMLARLVLSAMAEAALLIADAEDPVRARAEAEQALGTWLAGLVSTGSG
jgi:AcrR family transcriptional regulator